MVEVVHDITPEFLSSLDLLDQIANEIKSFEACYLTKYANIRRKAYPNLDNLPIGESEIASLHSKHAQEKDYLLGASMELCESLQTLICFMEVNRVGVLRMLCKIDRVSLSLNPRSRDMSSSFGSAISFHQSQYMDCIMSVRKLIENLTSVTRSRPTLICAIPDLEHFGSGPLCGLDGRLHLFTLGLGRSRKLAVHLGQDYNSDELALSKILNGMQPLSTEALGCKDELGRLPIHYATEYGLLDLCRTFLQLRSGTDTISSTDYEGRTPLHLSVINGHVEVTRYLLLQLRQDVSRDLSQDPKMQEELGSQVLLALDSNYAEIIPILLDYIVDINYGNRCGETPLFVAARAGHEGCVQAILDHSVSRNINIDAPEKIFGRTPLFAACIDGYLLIVRILLERGSDPNLCDCFGWTALEHAVFRGHMKISEILIAFGAKTPLNSLGGAEASLISVSSTAGMGLISQGEHRSVLLKGSSKVHSTWLFDRSKPNILVYLGPSNTRSDVNAVELQTTSNYSYDANHQAGYSLQIGVLGSLASCEVVQLPLLEDFTNKPLKFIADHPKEVKIIFDLYRASHTDYGSSKIGSGVAILKDLQERMGSKHESLVRDHKVPIIEKDTLKQIGSVVFNFMVVMPFPHTSVSLDATKGFWKSNKSIEVVGHRGSGANTALHDHLQIGENTMQSFLSAVASGASCVEFDVQLTKDLAPVIFHDFIVMETGGDILLQSLTFDQFMHLSRLQSLESNHLTGEKAQRQQRRLRSYSLGNSNLRKSEDICNRMRYTEEGIHNEIKGNLRGHSIQEPSTSLEELLTKLPESVAFNLEMSKMVLGQ